MARAYYSDNVLDGSGKPVVGASCTLLRASDYASQPTSDPGPGSANYISQTTSGPGGQFVFDFIPYDDYHLMVQYAGITTFRYNVPLLPAEMADTASTHGRVLVPRTLLKLLDGESTVIHFVGDSITVGFNSTGTVGANFVQRCGVLIGQQIAPKALVQRYDPNAYGVLEDGPINGWNGPTTIGTTPVAGTNGQIIQCVNNGVSGDTVQRVLRRFGNITGWTPVIDMIVLYLGVNDSLTNDPTKFVDPDSFYYGYRGLVDAIQNFYPLADLVIMTPHANDQPDAGNGGTIPAGTYALDDYAMAIRRVAIEQGVALVDLRRLWADCRDPNNLNNSSDGYPSWWLNNNGGNHTHPSDQGHQSIAEEFMHIFGEPGLSEERPQRIQTLGPRKHHKDLEVMRLPVQSPAIVEAGGHWSSYTPDTLSFLFYSSTLQRSKTAGDTLTFVDRMQDFAILTRRNTDCGQISVTVDGGTPTVYDLHRQYPTNTSDTTTDGATYPLDKLYVARGMGDGNAHSVVITVLGTHNPSASDSYFYCDGVEYTRWGHTSQKLECPIELSKIQYGNFSGNIAGAKTLPVTFSFPKPFRSGNNPSVVAICTNNQDYYLEIDSISPTGCTARFVHRDGTNDTTTLTATYIAIG